MSGVAYSRRKMTMRMIAAIAAIAALGLVACTEAETEQAADDAAQAAHDAGEAIGEAADATGEAVEGAVNDAAASAEAATDDNAATQP